MTRSAILLGLSKSADAVRLRVGRGALGRRWIAVARPLDRLLDALLDPSRRERTLLILLAAYVLCWTLYGVIAKSSQDIHFDMGEAVAWGHEADFGNPKHPPLSGWLPGAWFAVMPQTDWAYYLLAIVLAAVALWAAWRVAGDYLTPEKQVVGFAALTLVPFFNFHALKYNANSVMTPFWALTTWAFLRSFETRGALPAALAGLAAAGAMLGKYWSAVLLTGLGLAALADPRRFRYLRSAAPWITIAVGAVALLAHAIWLYRNGFGAFSHAVQSHPASMAGALISALRYAVNTFAYGAPAIILIALAAWPSGAALRDLLWPGEPRRRLVVLAFVLPIVLPALPAVLTSQEVVSIWGIGGLTLLPIVLLASPRIRIRREMARRVLAVALAFPLVALALSPVVALAAHWRGTPNHADQYRLAAQAVMQAWRAATSAPLRLVGSYNNLLWGMVLYLPGETSTYEIVTPRMTPWTGPERIAREGIALICPTDEGPCLGVMAEMIAAAGAPPAREIALTRYFLGIPGPTQTYQIGIIPPGALAPTHIPSLQGG